MNKAQGATTRARRRNARGQGERLAEEIVAGAMAIIERTGTDDAVTLRSVAREVGIAAPSIYAHFADRDAILWAVVGRVFEEVRGAVEVASAGHEDPIERLLAGCEAYVRFGLGRPAIYRALFARQFPPGITGSGAARSTGAAAPTIGAPTVLLDDRFPAVGGEAFALLVDGIDRCVASGESDSTDPFGDATAVWVALHGMVSLWSTVCDFPWPERDEFIRRLVLSLARIDVHPGAAVPMPATPRARRTTSHRSEPDAGSTSGAHRSAARPRKR